MLSDAVHYGQVTYGPGVLIDVATLLYYPRDRLLDELERERPAAA